MTGGAGETSLQSLPTGLSAHEAVAKAMAPGSGFYQRLQRRYEAQLPMLPTGAPNHASLSLAFDALRAQGAQTGAALRILRQLVMHRLIELDCDQQQSLGVITRSVTELAEFALNQACAQQSIAGGV